MALRILLADDSMTAQNMGKKILEEAGYDVVTVSNGAAAIKKVAEVAPDMVVLDVYMPGYNGLEVCERLKAAPETAGLPILLTVGKMEPFRPEDGAKVKADRVIIKPFEATDLVAVVSTLIGRAAPPPPPAHPVAEPATPTQPAAAPALAAAVAAGTENELDNFAQTAAVSASVIDVAEAPGLETFTPDTSAVPSTSELSVEFTASAPMSGFDEEALAGLEPTVLSQNGEAVAPGAAVMDYFNTVTSSAPSDGDSEWHVEEASLNADEMNIDLAAEMRAASAAEVSAAIEAAKEAIRPAATVSESLPPVSSAKPVVAPLGKTSFDEFDSLLENSAQRFELPPPPDVRGIEAQPDFMLTDERGLDTNALDTFEEISPVQSTDLSEGEPDLISEEMPAPTPEITAPGFARANALNGVFEMPGSGDAGYPAAEETDVVEDLFVSAETLLVPTCQQLGEPEESLQDAPEPTEESFDAVTTVEQEVLVGHASTDQDLVLAALSPTLEDVGGNEQQPMDAEEDVHSVPSCAPAAASELTIPPSCEHAIEPVLDEHDSVATQVEPSDPQIAEDAVERIVTRVMTHLKPIITVLVEEIVREMKR